MKNSKKKSIKKSSVNQENFLDEENNDRRLIVFIALAILVIVATIIGLLVGCKKEEKKEPVKPVDNVVVPVKKDEKEEYSRVVRELPVVRKVVKVTVKSDTNEDDNDLQDEENSETNTYNVTYYLNDNEEIVELEEGKTINEYVPVGYSDCKYYSNNDLTEEADVTEGVFEDKVVYLSCSIINYTINYSESSNNVENYNLEDGEIVLEEPTQQSTHSKVFQGWYTDIEFNNRVTSLNKDVLKYANENNVIFLYAKLTDNYTVNYYDSDSNKVDSDTISEIDKNNYTVKDGSMGYCSVGEFIGWSNTSGSDISEYDSNDIVSLETDMNLYPVCEVAPVMSMSVMSFSPEIQSEEDFTSVENEVDMQEETVLKENAIAPSKETDNELLLEEKDDNELIQNLTLDKEQENLEALEELSTNENSETTYDETQIQENIEQNKSIEGSYEAETINSTEEVELKTEEEQKQEVNETKSMDKTSEEIKQETVSSTVEKLPEKIQPKEEIEEAQKLDE